MNAPSLCATLDKMADRDGNVTLRVTLLREAFEKLEGLALVQGELAACARAIPFLTVRGAAWMEREVERHHERLREMERQWVLDLSVAHQTPGAA